MDWTTIAVASLGVIVGSLIGGLIGGWVSGWRIAHKLGQWQQSVDDGLATHESRLAVIDQRLDKGGERLEDVRLVKAVQATIREEVKEFRATCGANRREIYADIKTLRDGQVAVKARCDATHKRST